MEAVYGPAGLDLGGEGPEDCPCDHRGAPGRTQQPGRGVPSGQNQADPRDRTVNLAGAVLAAGSSSRFGTDKLIQQLEVVEHVWRGDLSGTR